MQPELTYILAIYEETYRYGRIDFGHSLLHLWLANVSHYTCSMVATHILEEAKFTGSWEQT